MVLKDPDKAYSLFSLVLKIHLSNKYIAEDIIDIKLTAVLLTSFTITTTNYSLASRKECAAACSVTLPCTRGLSK
jgi:hypothetical protein